MRARHAALAAFVLLAPSLTRAETSPSDAAAIRSVISGQIDAFRQDDAAGAFAFASPSIQGLFGTPAGFLAMVQHSYLPVYRPGSVDFTALRTDDGSTVQDVEVIGPDGLAYTARYTMEKEADGSWRIDGCQLLESHRLGT